MCMAYTQQPPVESPFIGEYKGKPTITIGTGKNSQPWSFGQGKAKVVVANLEAIQQFAETGDGNSTYMDKPTLELDTGNEKYPWSFGQTKAQAIVQNFDAIQQFAQTGSL